MMNLVCFISLFMFIIHMSVGDYGCGLNVNSCNYECFRYCIVAGYGSGGCQRSKCMCSWNVINETLIAMQANPNLNPNYNPNLNPNFNPNVNTNVNPNVNPNSLNNNFNTNPNPNSFNNNNNFNRNNNPNVNPNVDSNVNSNINPNLNPNINPNVNRNTNPNTNDFRGGVMRGDSNDQWVNPFTPGYLTGVNSSRYVTPNPYV